MRVSRCNLCGAALVFEARHSERCRACGPHYCLRVEAQVSGSEVQMEGKWFSQSICFRSRVGGFCGGEGTEAWNWRQGMENAEAVASMNCWVVTV